MANIFFLSFMFYRHKEQIFSTSKAEFIWVDFVKRRKSDTKVNHTDIKTSCFDYYIESIL